VRFPVLAFCWLLASSASAQTVTSFGSFWIRYFNQTRLTEKITLNAHLDERILFNPSRQFQLFTHLHVNYLAKPWLDVGLGGNFNWTNAVKNPGLKVPELRPWQETTLIKQMPRNWQFQFRYRLDERFIHNNDGMELLDGYHFNFRHRFRPQLSYTFYNESKSKRYVFRVSDEFMLNTGNITDTFDQNRFYFSLEVPLAKKWTVETGYMNQLQSRPSDDNLNDRHLIRVSIYHKVDLRRSDAN
jgi:Protein of unknown function (DUF2490)